VHCFLDDMLEIFSQLATEVVTVER